MTTRSRVSLLAVFIRYYLLYPFPFGKILYDVARLAVEIFTQRLNRPGVYMSLIFTQFSQCRHANDLVLSDHTSVIPAPSAG